MHALLTSLRLSSPFHQIKSLSPFQADIIKTIALLAMLADHINTILLNGHNALLSAVGHSAFPLFTLIWAINLPEDSARLRQRAKRLWLWALATQPLFWLAFMMKGQSWLALNILFAYAGCTQLLSWSARWGVNGAMAGLAVLLLLAWPLTPASYGIPGIVFCLLCMAARCISAVAESRLFLMLVFVAMAWLSLPGNGYDDTLVYDLLPGLVLPLLIITAVAALPHISATRLWPRRFFYHAYAGHLTLLGVLAVMPVRL
ncbi:TraX family protein [Pantoea sp. At-9b]|uniref:TraX family protein n=1 Tax=Pantoea sp. (strain At-9b) TaxID=592316 RepID=UPI0001B3FADE|nr:TraX family protein [Pantoea sp. At-9b]ADU72257.1 TraX family protein [Pantoea sp. At-9b]